MSQNRIVSAMSGAFYAPFHGLAFFCWVFFVWAWLVFPDTPILHGMFADSDDIMHLVRVGDWLSGQGWFDPFIHRLAPPDGVALHYSRLAELPLAALIWPMHQLGASMIAASYVAAFIWPLVLLAAFFCAMRWFAESFMQRDFSRVTAYISLFATPMLAQFSPGRVDHHGLSAIITLLSLGFLFRLMRQPERLKWALGAGFFLALGPVVAMESLPWLLLCSGWVGLWTMIKGRSMAASSMVFGFTLYAFSSLLLAITVSPAHYFDLNPLAYSYLYVLLAGGMSLGLVLVGFAARYSFVWPRYVLGALSSTLFSVWFLKTFPELRSGPYGGMDPELARLMLSSIAEAMPMVNKVGSYAQFISLLFMPLLALIFSIVFMMRADNDDIWKWFFSSLLLLVAIGLTAFYQVRVILYALLFSIVPLTVLLQRGIASARETLRGRKLFAAELYLLLLVGPIAGVLLPAVTDDRSFREGILLFPAIYKADTSCMPPALWQVLTMPSYYGDRSHLIMNDMNEGASILFHTNHKVLSAPYHTNVAGNLSSIRFFTALDEAEAQNIMAQTGADLVLMCQNMPALYKSKPTSSVINQDGSSEKNSHPTFAEQLRDGTVPSWLKRVELPFLGQALLFERRDEFKK